MTDSEKTGPQARLRESASLEALNLVQELWPKPYYATVTLETHQWERLRKLLLLVPELGDLS